MKQKERIKSNEVRLVQGLRLKHLKHLTTKQSICIHVYVYYTCTTVIYLLTCQHDHYCWAGAEERKPGRP